MPAIRKRILVAGGSGFLGTNLSKALLLAGHTVTVLDNFSRSPKENLAHLTDFGDLQILTQDVEDPIDIEIDEIYNLACDSVQPDTLRQPHQTPDGVSNLLSLACSCNARMVQSSSAKSTEILCRDFHLTYGVDVRVASIFYTYGPFMPPLGGGVVANLIIQALSNRPITIYGDGNQALSLCFVDDMVSGLRALMDCQWSPEYSIGLGSPQEHSIFELAQKVIALIGSSSSVVFESLPKKARGNYRPDIAQAKQLLNWQPAISLEEGLIRTITYFESVLQRNTAWAVARANSRFSLNRPLTDSREIIV